MMVSEAAVKHFAKAMSEIFTGLDPDSEESIAAVDQAVGVFRKEIVDENRELFLDSVEETTEVHLQALLSVGNFDTPQQQMVGHTMHSLTRNILGIIDGDSTPDEPGYALIRKHEDSFPEFGDLAGSLGEQYYALIQS